MPHLQEVEKSTPRDREVLVKVHTTTVTIGDKIMRSPTLPIHGWQKLMGRLILGRNKPRRHILDIELAGLVESIGRKVTHFKPGDPVFASTYAVNFGSYALQGNMGVFGRAEAAQIPPTSPKTAQVLKIYCLVYR